MIYFTLLTGIYIIVLNTYNLCRLYKQEGLIILKAITWALWLLGWVLTAWSLL